MMPLITQKLKELGDFVKDHFIIVVLGAIAATVFFTIKPFREMGYGSFRAAVAVFWIATILYAWFKDSVRKYLVSGDFASHFAALEPKYKIAATLGILYIISRVVTDCLTHA